MPHPLHPAKILHYYSFEELWPLLVNLKRKEIATLPSQRRWLRNKNGKKTWYTRLKLGDRNCYICGKKVVGFAEIAAPPEGAEFPRSQIIPVYINLDSPTHFYFTVDHIVPRSRGGADNNDNTRLCCVICNRNKDDKILGKA